MVIFINPIIMRPTYFLVTHQLLRVSYYQRLKGQGGIGIGSVGFWDTCEYCTMYGKWEMKDTGHTPEVEKRYISASRQVCNRTTTALP